jgi:hypothetical protein
VVEIFQACGAATKRFDEFILDTSEVAGAAEVLLDVASCSRLTSVILQAPDIQSCY